MSPVALRIAPLELSSSSCSLANPTILYLPSSHCQVALRRRNGKQILMPNYRHQFRRRCINDSEDNYANESSDISSAEQTDSTGKENHQQESLTTNEILKKLKRYGISGMLSYGLLNTAYYLCTFLFVWELDLINLPDRYKLQDSKVAPAPGRMGYVAAAERFLKILAMVWAGSQVTKLIRAGRALALAPAVDRGLSWFTTKYKFESQGKAFVTIAGFCFGLVFLVFLVLPLLWT